MAAAASVGMSEGEMWRTCPAFLFARLRAQTNRDRFDLELRRMQTYITVKPHYSRGMTMRKMWPLPTDKKIKADHIQDASPELSARFERTLRQIIQQKHGSINP